MAKKRVATQKLYGTKQVAEILDIPEWRVKNFTEGGAYGLSPSQTIGSGRGSRRVYNENDVLRLAIANELVNCGFTPESVGRGVREIPESHLTDWYSPEIADKADGDDEWPYLYALVCTGGKWQEELLGKVEEWFKNGGISNNRAQHGVFILNFPMLLEDVIKRMNQKSVRDAKTNPQDGGKR
jgi:hypothetical protein